MRRISVILASTALAAAPSRAADTLKFGPAPDWVVQQVVPTGSSKSSDAPIALLLNDGQIRFEPGKMTSYSEFAMKLQTADGLAAGNIAFPWQPATDTITINKLQIIRDGKIIDVLKAGQNFTVLRRETNLEAATLSGALTASIQPEGLQVGDIIDLAITDEQVDPVLGDHLENSFSGWRQALELGHFRASWPVAMHFNVRQTGDLPQLKQSTSNGMTVVEVTAHSLEPPVLPKDAPVRFQVGRLDEISDFNEWSQVADLMLPLYAKAATIPATGPLRDEVESIRKAGGTPKQQAEKALELVEQRVRYVALLMGDGGYTPAPAETTWSRRFGDCKGKSALLIGLLRELGVEAEPVIVHHSLGDILPDRLPGVTYFDHVIVRAHLGGNTYWLDGTRTGDTDLDRLPTGDFEWGLPIIKNSKLVAIPPTTLTDPQTVTDINIDLGAGFYAPAPFTSVETVDGDAARALNSVYAQLSAAQLDLALKQYWRSKYDYLDVQSAKLDYDETKPQLRISVAGSATLDWDDGWFFVPGTTVGFKPDFSRAEGPLHDSPFSLSYPSWTQSHVVVKLPAVAARSQLKMPPAIHEALAGTRYDRDVTISDSSVISNSSERVLQNEIAYKDAIAAAGRIKAIYDEDVYIHIPGNYVASDADLKALALLQPESAKESLARGMIYLSAGKLDEAVADFSQAIARDPSNQWALADRGLAYVWKQEFDKAKADFAATDAIDPKNGVVQRGRALLADMQGDYEAAAAGFADALVTDPSNTLARLRLASDLSELGRSEEALKNFTMVLDSDPDNVEALTGRAWTYEALTKYDLALADSEAALKIGTPPPRLRLARANIFRNQGMHQQTVQEAELLMKENPQSDYAFVAAGKILAAEGQRDRALDAFDQAAKIAPSAYIYINRSQIRDPGDFDGRMADLDQALKLEPDSPDAIELKAELLLLNKRPADALKVYDTAPTSVGGDLRHYRRIRAIALHEVGRTAEAEAELAKLRAESATPSDLNDMCWEKAINDVLLDSALEDCQAAVAARPESAAFRDSLGMTFLRLKRFDEAIAAYSKAIESAHIADSYMGRAIAYAGKGDMARAAADRAEAVKQVPDVEAEFALLGLRVSATKQ